MDNICQRDASKKYKAREPIYYETNSSQYLTFLLLFNHYVTFCLILSVFVYLGLLMSPWTKTIGSVTKFGDILENCPVFQSNGRQEYRLFNAI